MITYMILFAVLLLVLCGRQNAATSTTRLNLIEWAQNFHRGKLLPEIKMLAQDNAILSDIPWMVCNDGTTHLYRMTTALPTVAKTAYGEGTPESKSQRAQERETCTMLTGFSTIEEDLGQLYGGMGAVRALEDENFSEALKQQFARSLFYDNRGSSLKDIYGLLTRYNTLTGVKAKNTLGMGGTTGSGQTSVYFAHWGPDCYGIFPEGTMAGYQKIDLGRQVKTLASGNQLVVRQTKHLWHIGLVISAWQSAGRIGNIEVINAKDLGGNLVPTNVNGLLHKIVQMKMRFRRPGRTVAYCNDTVYSAIMRIGMEKSNAAVTIQNAATQFGQFEELRIFNMPVRRCDQILDTEAVFA